MFYDRVIYDDSAMLCRFDSSRSNDDAGIFDTYLHSATRLWTLCIGGPDSDAAIILDYSIENVNRSQRVLVKSNIDTVLRKAENKTIFYVQILAGKKTDAIESRIDAVESQI